MLHKIRPFSMMALIAVVLTGAVLTGPASAAQTPEGLQSEALTGVQVAMKLAQQAQALLAAGQTRESLRTAINLYAQAGRLFEKSENLFRTLGEKYASPEDVAMCARSKDNCIAAIQKIKEALGGR